MILDFDITTPNKAYSFLLNVLKFRQDKLTEEYLNKCDKDTDLFWERNAHRLVSMNIQDIHFIAFHITASLDNCCEIKKSGIRNLQYVLSHNTILSKLLEKINIQFDIKNRTMLIDDVKYNVDYNYYQNLQIKNPLEEHLESVAHRLYYDYCVDGFFVNDSVENYGTRIHERPEFINTLIELSQKADKLDEMWSNKSTPYKIIFYATANQIHKFTFDLKENCEPYTKHEQDNVKKWMLTNALERTFGSCREQFIYIRDDEHIKPEQIIQCEKMNFE